ARGGPYTVKGLSDLLATAEPEPGAFAVLRELTQGLKKHTDRHLLYYLVLLDTWYGPSEYADQTFPLALAIVQARPGPSLRYLATMFWSGRFVAAINSYVQVVLLGALLLLLAFWHGRFIVRGLRGSMTGPAPSIRAPAAAVRALHLLLLVGGAFTVCK